MMATDRVKHPVDGDIDVQSLRDRYAVLKGYKEQVEREMDELKEKMLVRMDEHGATALTVAGTMVTYVSRYDRVTVDAKALREKHPRLFKQFANSTPVTQVTIK
jgi:hypothetical protein